MNYNFRFLVYNFQKFYFKIGFIENCLSWPDQGKLKIVYPASHDEGGKNFFVCRCSSAGRATPWWVIRLLPLRKKIFY